MADRGVFRGQRTFMALTLNVLRTELDRFANEVADAFQRVSDGTPPRWRRTSGVVRSASALAFGELPRVSPDAAAIVLTLPAATSVDAGRSVRFLRTSTANAVTLRAPSTSVTINGATGTHTATSAVGWHEYTWDGEAWWGRA